MTRIVRLLAVGSLIALAGCTGSLITSADRRVYDLIDERQQTALGERHDIRIREENGEIAGTSRMYSFTPGPMSADVPPEFQQAEQVVADAEPVDADEGETASTEPSGEQPAAPMTASIFTPEQEDQVVRRSLEGMLAYALKHGRDLQNAKEDLYLAALDLTLERHLWTPRFMAGLETTFDGIGDDAAPTGFDRAMRTVSDVSVRQELPFGGFLTAQAIHTLTRQVSDMVDQGSTGQVILSANLPLLRGAGPVAYENRYQRERNLIYAVRTFERFRRAFVVGIATDYFNLQQAKAAIANTYKSFQNRENDWEKADFIHKMGRSRDIAEAPRAKANFRSAEAALVSAKERYATSLDRFKIRIGMPVDRLLDVVDQDLDESARAVDDLMPDIRETVAVETAVRYRLDLLNSFDQLDDFRRGVLNAKNAILPDLTLSGSYVADSDADRQQPARLREERATWQAALSLSMSDRREETTAYRRTLVVLRREERNHAEFVDIVRSDVRRAARRIDQEASLQQIQLANRAENATRLDAARAQVDLGRSTNQDVVDAENELLRAENALAQAIANHRRAILEFRRDTGTLRVTDSGRWGTVADDPGA